MEGLGFLDAIARVSKEMKSVAAFPRYDPPSQEGETWHEATLRGESGAGKFRACSTAKARAADHLLLTLQLIFLQCFEAHKHHVSHVFLALTSLTCRKHG